MGRRTPDLLYTLQRVLEGLWEFAHPVDMCSVDVEKAFNRVPRHVLSRVLQEYGAWGPLLVVVQSLYGQSRSLVCMAGRVSDWFPVHVVLRQGCNFSPRWTVRGGPMVCRRSVPSVSPERCSVSPELIPIPLPLFLCLSHPLTVYLFL